MALCLLEWLADSLCLAMLQRVCGRRIRLRRTLLAGGAGVLMARGLQGLSLPRGWAAALWLPAAQGLAGLAGCGFSLRSGLLLMACAGLLGGTVAALAGALGSLRGAWALGAALAAAMARSVVRERRMASPVHAVRIRVTCMRRTAAFSALVDSGNSLRDYLTHRPVIVLPDAARREFGLERRALRPIFADTAGGRQMMACFTPDNTLVETDDGLRAVEACIAFSPGLRRGTPALLPQALMEFGHGQAAK